MGQRVETDSSDEPTPPRRTLLDWVGTVMFALIGTPLILLCVATMGEGFFYQNAAERVLIITFSLGLLGLPGALCWRLAWRCYSGKQAKWRRSMRGRRRLCIRCGYDLRGGVEVCPECGMPVPEPIDRIAARLEMMTGGASRTNTGDDGKEHSNG